MTEKNPLTPEQKAKLDALARRNDERFAEMQKQTKEIDFDSPPTGEDYPKFLYNGDYFPDWGEIANQMVEEFKKTGQPPPTYEDLGWTPPPNEPPQTSR